MPKQYTPTERESIIAHNLDIVSASEFNLTDEMLSLAQRLSRIHGRIRVTNEASGIHFYMPSPKCLEDYGEDELFKMHLAVNVQKYFEKDADNCGLCMKTNTPYRVSDLESMAPLDERGYELKPQVIKVARANMEFMEKDPVNDAWIPKSPGEVTPVYQLPHDHPAQQYLRYRKFDAEQLWHQFRLSYCSKERSDIYYRNLLNGFKASPQGRIIFYIDIDKINRGWQARILDFERDGVRYYYQPYSKKWVPVLRKVGEKWQPFDDRWVGWEDAKYIIGHGCKRNECLLGYDAAVKWNEVRRAEDPNHESWCVLAEGGLDAGRIGPPGMAIMGKAFSEGQCRLLTQFSRVIYVKDNDEAGEQAAATVQRRISESRHLSTPRLKVVSVPFEKDLGAMTEDAAYQFIQTAYQEL